MTPQITKPEQKKQFTKELDITKARGRQGFWQARMHAVIEKRNRQYKYKSELRKRMSLGAGRQAA